MKKPILLWLFCFLGLTLGAAPRINTTINSGWYFHKGDIALGDNDLSSKNWERINLPHTWNAADAFDEEPGYYRGIGWYAHTLRIPDQWKGKSIILHFEGANQVAEVYVNGRSIGKHTGGYTAFNFDITDCLDYGAKNTVKVKLDNSHNLDIPPLNADFTFYGGIYRNVRLVVTDPVHFDLCNHASDGVFVETPSVSNEKATLRVYGDMANSAKTEKKVLVESTVYDKAGTAVARGSVKLTLKPGAKTPFKIESLTILKPNLWSPESPYLYRSVTRITDQGKEPVQYDETVIPVGLRWFVFNGTDGFLLNGKKYPLRGSNRHQDFAGKGNALTDEYHHNDYARIKELGFNFVRLAHYPQAPEVYRTCDELGLLVWTEIPIVNEVTPTEAFTQNSLNMMREQIRQTRNHPSVILYGYMNEILIRMLSNSKLKEEERVRVATDTRNLALKLEQLTKTEAPDRNTVMAIHYEEGYNKYEVSTITDVLGYNLYFGWYYDKLEKLTEFFNSEHKRYPNRPIILSEFGADSDIHNHTLVPRPWDFSEEYQVVLHTSYLDQMAALPYLAGYAVWNFADFGAENRADATPWINQKGLVNYDRTDKDAVGLFRAAQLHEPVLWIASRNYTSRKSVESTSGSGTFVNPIKIFSNGTQVELQLNGRSLGKKSVASHQVCFDVPLTGGDNLLEAFDDRGTVDRLTLRCEVIPVDLRRGNFEELSVNVGSYQTFVQPGTKTIWVPDRVYTPGSWGRIGGTIFEKTDRLTKVGIFNNILGTDCNPLFQTFVEGIERFRFDVSDGIYCITFCFVESNPKSPTEEIIFNLSNAEADKAPAGVREFSVSVNGSEVINNLSLARDYGNLRAVQFDITTTARDNSGIEVAFTPHAGKTTLSGIRIRRLK